MRTRSEILKDISALEEEIDDEEDLREEEGVDSMNLDKAYEQLDALYAELEQVKE